MHTTRAIPALEFVGRPPAQELDVRSGFAPAAPLVGTVKVSGASDDSESQPRVIEASNQHQLVLTGLDTTHVQHRAWVALDSRSCRLLIVEEGLRVHGVSYHRQRLLQVEVTLQLHLFAMAVRQQYVHGVEYEAPREAVAPARVAQVPHLAHAEQWPQTPVKELQVLVGNRAPQPRERGGQTCSAVAIELVARPVDRAQDGRNRAGADLPAPLEVLPHSIQVEEVDQIEAAEVRKSVRTHLDDGAVLLERLGGFQDLGGVSTGPALQVGSSEPERAHQQLLIRLDRRSRSPRIAEVLIATERPGGISALSTAIRSPSRPRPEEAITGMRRLDA